MKLTGETKFFIAIIIGSIALVGIGMMMFSRPEPTYSRQDLMPENVVTKGNLEASVYLVEFSDFQCPSCKAAFPIVASVVEKYQDKMVFAYRHFPLDRHEFAVSAAYAAEAAGKQGKFWEMHDLIFENQDELSDEKIQELAESLELDMDMFEKDFSSSELADKVTRDRSFGARSGVNSTPTFFLNGEKLQLNNLNDLKTEIEKALQ